MVALNRLNRRIVILLACLGTVFWLPIMVQGQEDVVLRVATIEREPFVVERGTGYIGYSIELWDAIAEEIGVAYELVVYDEFPNMLDSVREKDADLAVANITISAEREETLDFSHSIYPSGLQIMVARTVEGSFSRIIQSIFASGILWVIGGALLILFIVANLIWFFERGDERAFHDDYLRGIWDAFWWATVTVTTVGYGDKVPSSVLGRILALIWMFFSLFLLSIFVAQISNIMSDTVLNQGIEEPEDLNGRRVATIDHSTAFDFLEGTSAIVLSYSEPAEMFGALESGSAEAAVFDAPVMAYYEATEGNGRVKLVGAPFQPEQFGIALQIDSPYRESINRAILKLNEEGVTQEIHDRWFSAIQPE